MVFLTLTRGFQRLRDELEKERVHALVWCAPGYGWEMQDDAHQPLTVDALCDVVATLKSKGCRVPRFAVLCFKHDARRAAARLAKAGIRTVLSLRMNVSEGRDGAEALSGALTPALNQLNPVTVAPSSLDDMAAALRQVMASEGHADAQPKCHGELPEPERRPEVSADDVRVRMSDMVKSAAGARDVLRGLISDPELQERDTNTVEYLASRLREDRRVRIVVLAPRGEESRAQAVALKTCRYCVNMHIFIHDIESCDV